MLFNLASSFQILVVSVLFPCVLIISPIALIANASNTKKKQLAFLVFSMTVLGGVVGILGGNSREPTVGLIIPSVLTFVGGATAFLFGIDRTRGLISSILLISLCLSLLVGYAGGSDARIKSERLNRYIDFCLSAEFPSDPKDPRKEIFLKVCGTIIGEDTQKLGPSQQDELPDKHSPSDRFVG